MRTTRLTMKIDSKSGQDLRTIVLDITKLAAKDLLPEECSQLLDRCTMAASLVLSQSRCGT